MDWDTAYDNSAAVAGSAAFFDRWTEDAAVFRALCTGDRRAVLDIPYGDHPRQRVDLFYPTSATPRGLLFHVHGGYWMRTDKSVWSHCAQGALEHGLAVAVPSYRLCPEVSIASITADVASALTLAAERVDGTVLLSGHSAGGHLVSRLLCCNVALPHATAERIAAALSISGLHDLRPLIHTPLNPTLQLSVPTARAESPALLEPRAHTHLHAWVGADELPEFRRQARLLPLIWAGQLAQATHWEVPGAHHFNVIDGLMRPDSAMLSTLVQHLD
ncbi:MAG: alpha/beta hydrolase [Pseudomonadota bacterium]